MFAGPWGMIIGPFAGAFVGELMGNRSRGHIALRVAMGAFVAFISGVGIKFIASGLILYYMVREIVYRGNSPGTLRKLSGNSHLGESMSHGTRVAGAIRTQFTGNTKL